MTTRQCIGVGVAMLAVLAIAPPQAVGQDWPQWRGPNRDGSVSAFDVPASWPAGLTEQWKVEVGFGYATPILVGERVYVFSRQGRMDSHFTSTTSTLCFRSLWESLLVRIFISHNTAAIYPLREIL